MKTGAFGRGLALAALYIGILTALVIWQFPLGGKFSLSAGDLVFKGERNEDGKSLVSGSLNYGGLSFVFSPSSPLRWTASNGNRKESLPLSFKETNDGFRILFSDGIELLAYCSKEPVPRVGLEFKKQSGSFKNVTLSVRPIRRSRITSERSSFFVEGSTGRYFLEIPDGSFSDDRKTITLPLLSGKIAPVVISKAEEGSFSASIRFLEQAAMAPEAFNREILAYRDKVWKGLSSERYVPGAIQWKDADGKASFSETALTAYLAEAWYRGVGPSASEKVRAANEQYPDALTYLSVPFMGQTTARMRVFEEKDLAEVKRIERLVQTKSPSLLEKPGLVQFLLDRAPYSLARDAFQMVQSLDLGSLTAVQAVGGLSAWAEGEDLFTSEENPFAKFEAIAERQILPAIAKAGEGFFLTTSPDGTSNLPTSIRAGWALIKLGESSGKTMFVGIGQSLILGALRLSDAQGFLPQSVVVRNGSVTSRSEKVAPEETYALTAKNPYYPHEVSFYKEVGPSAWVWTCSPSVSVSADAESMVWTLEFPEHGVHFLAAYGVKPFTKMQLYGLDYPMDPAFENYNASGYLYRRASNVVYFKMRHKSKTEDIRMFY